MLRLNAAIFITIFCTYSVFAQSTVQDYVNKYHKTAISQMERTGIPASILLSSGILESFIGNSQLALQANNHFNIKCERNWNGEFFYQWEKNQKNKPSCYRVYELAEESYLEFANRLISQSSISSLVAYSAMGYKQWAIEVSKLNFSSRLSDADQMIRLIESFDLSAFDNRTSKKENLYQYSSRKIHNIHGLKAVIASSEDTPLGIATEFRLPYRRILKYNDLEEGDGFKPNQIVFLEAKRNNSDIGTEYHEMNAGETMYDISQLYGVKLKVLLKFNHVNLNDKIASGERVYLREDAPIRPRLVGERPVQKPVTKPKDEVIADNGSDAPGINDKIKYRPQRKPILPPTVEKEKEKEEIPVIEDEPTAADDDMGYVVHDPKIKVEEPRIVPVKKPAIVQPSPGANRPTKNNVESLPPPGKSSKVDAQNQLEGAPVPIIPGGIANEPPPPGKANKNNVQAIEENPLLEKPEPREGYHIVEDEETLYSIALKHGTTVEAIRLWNGLRNNTLEIGQELKISGRK